MSEFLPFVIIGLVTGSVYGLAGTGLVLTYKTSGIFNFGYGSLAALTVFIFYFLHSQHGMAWPLAGAICLLVVAPIEGVAMEYFSRILENASATLKVVSTVGIILVVVNVGTLWYGNTAVNFPPYFSQSTVEIGGVFVTWNQIIVFIIACVVPALLYYFLRYVRLGVAMRGVVDNPDLVSMTGESPIRVRRWSWIIGMFFVSLAGLLLAPNLSLNALIITLLVVQAFGSAAFGYFSNLPLTFAGGLAIGVIAALSSKYVTTFPALSGLPVGLPFIILFIVLIVMPRARLAERRVTRAAQVRKSYYAPTRVRLVWAGLIVAVLCFIPQLSGSYLSIWSSSLIDIILFLSLGLLVRLSGQISLCHYAFAAIGAAAFCHFTDDWHIPWLAALLLAGLLTVPVGALIAIPAIRLSGVFLAIATYGFGLLLEQMFYTTGSMFGPTTSGLPSPRPDISIGGWQLYTDNGFYYVLLIAALITVALLVFIQKGRMGRLLGALADSPIGLSTHGASTNVIRVTIFSITAGIAGIAGALFGSLYHFAAGVDYASFNSLTLVVLVVIIVAGDPWWAVMAAFGFNIFPGYVNVNNITTYTGILFGVSAMMWPYTATKVQSFPKWLARILDRLGGRKPALEAGEIEEQVIAATGMATMTAIPTTEVARAAAAGSAEGLEVKNLVVHFGGIHAVQGVTLSAPLGHITGLVGPNGAGKTTMFNVCSGITKPTEGGVSFRGRDITALGLAKRSRLGLGRTFQRPELFNSLTVRENLALGREASLAGANAITQLITPRGDRAVVKKAIDEAVALTGIGPLLPLQAGLLPIGQRRMVELARCLAGPFDMLLLDEPSSGLNGFETQRFGQILLTVAAQRGAGILLVEHDMELVRQVCENIYVLDFGLLIFEGSPNEMMASPVVRSAYLGEEGSGDAALPIDEEATELT